MRLPTSGYDSNQDISTPEPEDHVVEEVDTTEAHEGRPKRSTNRPAYLEDYV